MPISSRERMLLAEDFMRQQREEFESLSPMGPVQSFIQHQAASAGFITPRMRRAFEQSLAFNQEMAQQQVQGLLDDLLDTAAHTHSPQNTERLAQIADELGRIEQRLYGPDPGAAAQAMEESAQLRGALNGILESERTEQRALQLERRGEIRQRGNEITDAMREETMAHDGIRSQITSLLERGTAMDAPITDFLRGQLMDYAESGRLLRGTDPSYMARAPIIGRMFSTEVEPISVSEAADILDQLHNARRSVLSNEYGQLNEQAQSMGLEPFITPSGQIEMRDIGLMQFPERLNGPEIGTPQPTRIKLTSDGVAPLQSISDAGARARTSVESFFDRFRNRGLERRPTNDNSGGGR